MLKACNKHIYFLYNKKNKMLMLSLMLYIVRKRRKQSFNCIMGNYDLYIKKKIQLGHNFINLLKIHGRH